MEVRQKKKKSKVRLRISFILLFCAASLICCFTLYLKENQPESYYDNDGEIVETIPENAFLPVPESSARSQRYLKNCVFVGGSTVKALAEYGFIEEENAFYGDFSADDVYERAESSLIPGIYIMPDVSSEDSFDADMSIYGKMTDKLSANSSAKIYVSSLMPDTEAEKNDGVDRINERLSDFAESHGVYYLDICSELRDKNGALPSVYYSDGKLEKEACGRISAYILSHTVR
ncbi:MAG: SGNH/GDSL hydrolase family protein [Oscillospiraceae bacterium]